MKISVYVPTKNRVQLLNRAVRSVLAQTYQNWELVVVNDGSTDATRSYLDDLVKSDPRVKVIHNDRSRGGSGARNIALRHATGTFATGLDDDDYFLPGRLEQLMRLWNEKTGLAPACVFTPIIPECNGVTSFASQVPSMVRAEDFFTCNSIGSQIFAPTSHYFDAGLFDELMPAWQDYEFFMRVLKKCGAALSGPVPSYVYDASPRQDRISKQSEEKLRTACNRMISLYAQGDPIRTQQLKAQIYQSFYGLSPSLRELIEFYALNPSVWSFKRVSRVLARKISNDIGELFAPQR